MSNAVVAPWHRASFDRFLNERLPQLLAERLPLGGYQVEPTGTTTCRIRVTLAAASGEIEAIFDAVPQPDAEGVFEIEDKPYAVVPTASQDELDLAEIRCVGEQFYAYIESRLGQAPPDMTWDIAGLRAWLPLDEWARDFLRGAQPLDTTNPLSRCHHLRRLLLPDRKKVFTRGHFGRTCPIETPEGPNIGRILSIARGAEIQDGKLVITDDRPEAGLGLSASLIPFLEHCDPCRLTMGANMMRQWLSPPDPEPALIQTGHEPDDPAFPCGRNLLTAYISGGWDTFEDAILISESCARRLNYPAPVEPGDKLSNRYGNKGVISRILPDDRMPHLEDGTPVELVITPMGLYSRMTFGQLREAALSWVAKKEGKPIVVPSFHAPATEELRARLVAAGLPESGMRILRNGKEGPPLSNPSTVGWVYWGRLYHTSRRNLSATVTPARCQRVGDAEYHCLRSAGAFETIHEIFHTRAAESRDAETLAARVATGAVAQAEPPSPQFAALQRRLAVAGIGATLEDGRLTFRFAPPEGETLTLARPVAHPWHAESELAILGAFPESPAYAPLVEANAKLARMLAHQAPDSLKRKAQADLEARIEAFFKTLLTRDALEFSARVMFGGKAVSTPGGELHHDQLELPDEIAWTLFGSQLTRELGDAAAVQARAAEAATALDALMARSWILLHRAGVATLTGILAFHPARIPGPVLRIHPFVCPLLDADFDGDILAVSLPITEAGQREAGEKLTIAAHLRRDPSLLHLVRPIHDARFGLASLALTPEGHAEIEQLAGATTLQHPIQGTGERKKEKGESPITQSPNYPTTQLPNTQHPEQRAGVAVPLEGGVLNQRSLQAAQETLLQREGVEAMLDAMERLTRRGFEAAQASGASISPFPTAGIEPPIKPRNADPEAWNAYFEEYIGRLLTHFENPETNADPTALTLKSGARGSARLWLKTVGIQGVVSDLDGGAFAIQHGYAEGLLPEEFLVNCIGSREGMARSMGNWFEMQKEIMGSDSNTGYGVLARALRAKNPGIVFARAAASGESDSLDKPHTRLFVGLPAV